MQKLETVVDRIMDRGKLPERIRLTQSIDGAAAGTVFSWSPTDRAYIDTDRQWFVAAYQARAGWGRVFGPAQPMRVLAWVLQGAAA